MPQSEIAITQSSSTHSRLQQQLKMPLLRPPRGHYKTPLRRKVKDKHEPVTRPQHGKSSFIPKSPPLHLPEHHSVLLHSSQLGCVISSLLPSPSSDVTWQRFLFWCSNLLDSTPSDWSTAWYYLSCLICIFSSNTDFLLMKYLLKFQ